MLNKDSCLSILMSLEDRGINVDSQVTSLIISRTIPLDVLKFIVQHQGVEAVNFYEMIRKNHNKNKSPLYTNILNEEIDESGVTTTLSALLTQILLYYKNMQEKTETFFEEVRANEITQALSEYFQTGEITKCAQLLQLVRTDILVLEYANGRRELE